MVVAFLNMSVFIYRCCKVLYWESVYYTVFAFSIAECVASLEWQALNHFLGDVRNVSLWMQILVLIVIYGVLELFIWSLVRNRIPSDGYLDVNRKDWFTALFIGIVVFGVSNLRFVTTDTPFNGRYSDEIANARSLVDVAGVAMLYAHLVLCCENKIRTELEAVQNVLQNQYQQYRLSRESIELINYKYHDLKHQIAVLRSESDPEKRNSFLNKMEAEIKQYELQNKTGNDILDTVLTGKSLYCDKHGITLTSVVDGKLLEFMDVMDICSIFGNALDNAIESVLKIKDKEKRLIHVKVYQQKKFLLICIENYFEGDIYLEEGIPFSTKHNKQYHGYGIKSIRYTVNKYDGAVYIDTENGWFDLKILIPLKE